MLSLISLTLFLQMLKTNDFLAARQAQVIQSHQIWRGKENQTRGYSNPPAKLSSQAY